MFPDFQELLGLLNKNKVKYLVIGGYAVSRHAQPRVTKDLDILIQPAAKNAAAVFRDRNGLRAHFISRDDLIAAKLASGRLRDLADVEELRKAQAGDLAVAASNANAEHSVAQRGRTKPAR